MKNHQQLAEFWAQSDEAAGVTDELVRSKGHEMPSSRS